MFALADKKRTFIKDLENVTLEEMGEWIAFYELQYEEQEAKSR
jgi:hypothetical protein